MSGDLAVPMGGTRRLHWTEEEGRVQWEVERAMVDARSRYTRIGRIARIWFGARVGKELAKLG